MPVCPEIDPELVRYLESVFPDTVVNPDQTNPHQAYGRAEVVRHLKHQLSTQENGHVST